MTLHEDKERFTQAIESTAQYLGTTPIIIEKDYWVTYVLKNIAKSEFRDKVVFKGGTSLSKMYSCIDRFSEDIDLAIIPQENFTQSQLKSLIKNIEKVASQGLILVPGHELEVKKGKNRTTAYEYPRGILNSNFGNIKDVILIEINSFTTPTPHNYIDTISMIGYHFGVEQLPDLEEYELEPFSILTLDMQRTFFEKILSVNRHSYGGIDELKNKIRHFYDLHKLYQHADMIESFKNKENSLKILNQAINDEVSNRTFVGEWGKKSFNSSPLFSDLDGTWRNLKLHYKNSLEDLVWSELPPENEVYDTLLLIKQFLSEYDELYVKV